ncbi:MAG: DUF3185 domain-containing protein [Planctomycetes bacterium]|nr:DUF3185 domain-containing protein [Planctomycetota bacterium]
MQPKMMLGIVLIVLGAAGLIFPVITYTSHEPVNFFGVHFTTEKQETILIPGIVGGLAMVGGIAIVVVASKKSE